MEYTREHHMRDRFKTNGLMTNSVDVNSKKLSVVDQGVSRRTGTLSEAKSNKT